MAEEKRGQSPLVCCVTETEAEKESDERKREAAGEGKRHVVNQHSLSHPCAALVLVMHGSHFDVQPSLSAEIWGSGKFCVRVTVMSGEGQRRGDTWK